MLYGKLTKFSMTTGNHRLFILEQNFIVSVISRKKIKEITQKRFNVYSHKYPIDAYLDTFNGETKRRLFYISITVVFLELVYYCNSIGGSGDTTVIFCNLSIF